MRELLDGAPRLLAARHQGGGGLAPVRPAGGRLGARTTDAGACRNELLRRHRPSPTTIFRFQEPTRSSSPPAARHGRQERVLVEGTCYINRLFATSGADQQDSDPGRLRRRGRLVHRAARAPAAASPASNTPRAGLVETGCRGVWSRDPLMPGKPRASAPTPARSSPGADDQLHADVVECRSVEARTSTQPARDPPDHQRGRVRAARCRCRSCVHIDYRRRRRSSVRRFGGVSQLVEQTLDPMVSSYFKNVLSQTRTFIELIQSRSRCRPARRSTSASTSRPTSSSRRC